MVQSDYTYRADLRQVGAVVVDRGTGEVLAETVAVVEGCGREVVGLVYGAYLHAGGRFLSVRSGIRGGRGKGGLRGRVRGFSRASRRRLMRTLSLVRDDAKPLFVTLTYPGSYDGNPERWKRDIRVLWERLRRIWPGAAAIWRLEFQRRGAPHFHLFVWGVEYRALRAILPLAWYQVVGSGDGRHVVAGVRVEYLKSWRGILGYASKYLAKVDDSDGCYGRMWGILGRKYVPWADITIVRLSVKVAYQLIRLMRRYARLRSRAYQALTVNAAADKWLANLPLLC